MRERRENKEGGEEGGRREREKVGGGEGRERRLMRVVALSYVH